jgi:CubicO group peptidase (beta-lactamase class C family)
VRDLLDMTTAIQYSEDYANPQAEIFDYVRAGNVAPRPADYQGPDNFYAFMQSIRPQGDHGAAFAYKTINTDVLAWVLRRITGQTMTEYLSTQLWAPLGMEQDAYFTIDNQGTEFTGGGLNTGLRDLARFGELMRNHGALGNKQIIPSAVVADIQRGGDREKFKSGGYVLLPGWSYRDMWWITHNAHGAYMARGVHGQAIYIDPLAEMVIARYASHPIAANAGLDPTSLPAYHALAQHLMENPT